MRKLNPLGQLVASGGNPPPTAPTPQTPASTALPPAPKPSMGQRLDATGKAAEGAVRRGVNKFGTWAGTSQGQMTLGAIASGFSQPGSPADRLGSMAVERGQGMRVSEELAKFDDMGKLKEGSKLSLTDLSPEQQRLLLTMRESGLSRGEQRYGTDVSADVTTRGQDVNATLTREQIAAQGERQQAEIQANELMLSMQQLFQGEQNERDRRNNLAMAQARVEQAEQQFRAEQMVIDPRTVQMADAEAARIFYADIEKLSTRPEYAQLKEVLTLSKDPVTGAVDYTRLFGALQSDPNLRAQLTNIRTATYYGIREGKTPAVASAEAFENYYTGMGNVQSSATGTQNNPHVFSSNGEANAARRAGKIKSGEYIRIGSTVAQVN